MIPAIIGPVRSSNANVANAPPPQQPRRAVRIFYAAGPGDIIGTYRHWSRGEYDPSQIHVTYSAQFFDVCRNIGAQAMSTTRCPG